jgi:hypothetical protein
MLLNNHHLIASLSRSFSSRFAALFDDDTLCTLALGWAYYPDRGALAAYFDCFGHAAGGAGSVRWRVSGEFLHFWILGMLGLFLPLRGANAQRQRKPEGKEMRLR